MALFLLLLASLSSWAGEWLPAWELKFSGKPVAAFFSAHGSEILVSLHRGEIAELRRVSYEGKDLGILREEEGAAGPVRAYGERLYWAVGKRVVSLDHRGKRAREVAALSAELRDLALTAKGKLIFASPGQVKATKGVEVEVRDAEGLFQLLDELYSLKDGKIFRGDSTKPVGTCEGCSGLERGSDGSWISAAGKTVVIPGKGLLLAGNSNVGRIGYFYRRESREDLLLVPFPDEGLLRAYRAPSAAK